MRRSLPLVFVLAFLIPGHVHAANPLSMAPLIAQRWARDDAPVAQGTAQRSWTWGPDVIRAGVETYAQSPNRQRQVWYLDKARMEISHPDADPNAAWYITTGLLVRELIGGRVQVGDREYEDQAPALVPVAGDLEAPLTATITYADLRALAALDGKSETPVRTPGDPPITSTIAPGGGVGQDPRFASYGVRAGAYDDVLGHNIAKAFLDAVGADALLYVAGRPLTEAYWARVPVGKQPHDVLLQAFERRVLTYTPDNPANWQVEWGNVGRQYAQWRYNRPASGTTPSPSPTPSPMPTPAPPPVPGVSMHELQELSPAAAQIGHERQGYVGAAVFLPETATMYSFHATDEHFAMYSTVKVPIMLAVLDRTIRERRDVSTWERGQIEAMIKTSDNTAASALLTNLGGASVLEGYLRGMGLANTTIDPDAWGASMTTAGDMAILLAKLGGCTILSPQLCGYALDTMRNVIPSQRWGISAGAPDGSSVALKNGWYPDTAGWGVNSVGLVTTPARKYVIAIYTNPDPSEQYGIDTIEQMAAQIHGALR